METTEIGGLAITYRVERFMNGDWVDQGVAHASPYGALMSMCALDEEHRGLYRIADEHMPLGRRVTQARFADEDYRVGPVFEVPWAREDEYGRVYD